MFVRWESGCRVLFELVVVRLFVLGKSSYPRRNTFKDIQYTLPARLIQEKLKLRRVPSIIAQGKRDESKEVEMRGRIVVQLEGAAEDAQKGLCELKGETLFCHNLNVLALAASVLKDSRAIPRFKQL